MPDFRTQRGSVTFGLVSNTVDVTLPVAIDPARAFCLINATHRGARFAHPDPSPPRREREMGVVVDIVDSGATLRFTRGPGAVLENVTAHYVVVEYTGSAGGPNEWVVRLHSTQTLAAGATFGFIVYPALDPARSVAFVSAQRSSATTETFAGSRHTAQIFNPTVGTLNRAIATTESKATVVVIEFVGSNWTVHGPLLTHVFNAGDSGVDVIVGLGVPSVPSWSQAFILGGSRGDLSQNSRHHVVARPRVVAGVPSLNTIHLRAENSTPTLVWVGAVVSNPMMSVQHFGSYVESLGLGAAWAAGAGDPQTEDLTLTNVDTTRTFAILGATNDSNNVNLPASMWRHELLNATTLRARRQRSLGVANYAAQIVELPRSRVAQLVYV